MTSEFETGFQSGVLWAAAYVAGGLVDQPGIASELCNEAGITLRELKKCDCADQEAVNKIIAELLRERRASALREGSGKS